MKNAHVKGFLERLARADPRPDSLLHLLDSAVSGLGGSLVRLPLVVPKPPNRHLFMMILLVVRACHAAGRSLGGTCTSTPSATMADW
jgi:hypothetical protein